MYAELHCLTNSSFLEAASHTDEMVVRAAELGYSTLAITDVNTLAGVVRANTATKQSTKLSKNRLSKGGLARQHTTCLKITGRLGRSFPILLRNVFGGKNVAGKTFNPASKVQASGVSVLQGVAFDSPF